MKTSIKICLSIGTICLALLLINCNSNAECQSQKNIEAEEDNAADFLDKYLEQDTVLYSEYIREKRLGCMVEFLNGEKRVKLYKPNHRPYLLEDTLPEGAYRLYLNQLLISSIMEVYPDDIALGFINKLMKRRYFVIVFGGKWGKDIYILSRDYKKHIRVVDRIFEKLDSFEVLPFGSGMIPTNIERPVPVEKMPWGYAGPLGSHALRDWLEAKDIPRDSISTDIINDFLKLTYKEYRDSGCWK